MILKQTLAILIILFVGISVTAEGAAAEKEMYAYFVGNSLTSTITPARLHEMMAGAGIDLQFGTQMIGGSDLQTHLERLDNDGKYGIYETNKKVDGKYEPGTQWGDPLPKRFGNYFKALGEHKWDVIVLSPGVTSQPEKEAQAFYRFVDYAVEHQPEAQIYIYTHWLQRPVVRDANGKVTEEIGLIDFSGIWEGRVPLPFGGMPMLRSIRKDYYQFIDQANEHYQGKLSKPIRMMPLGDVFCELDKRVKAGKIPGIEALQKRDPDRVPFWDDTLKDKAGTNIFYADRVHPSPLPHTDATIGNYVYCLMFYSVLTGNSPVGLSGELYGMDDEKDGPLIEALQQCVWDVIKDHPYTGIGSSD